MDSLSTTAQALLAATFMSDETELRFGMQEHVPSAETAAALSELMSAGLVSEQADGAARIYRLTADGKAMDRHKPLAWMARHGRFPLAVPKRSAQAEGRS